MKAKIRMIITLSVIMLFMIFSTSECFAVSSLLNGFSRSTIRVINSSADSLKCTGRLTSSGYLINTGECINLRLTEETATRSFTGRATMHNVSAEYLYDGIKRYLIKIANYEFNSSEALCRIDKPGVYTAGGYMTFCWKTSTGKVTEGFPQYYYRTVYFSSPGIKVVDINGESGDETTGKENVAEPSLKGTVSHTTEWNKNRAAFNTYCRAHGKETMIRGENVFWSGEKFILSACTEGSDLPQSVSVSISGTDYSTALARNGKDWTGSLFDRSMIGKWGRDEPEELEFVFSGIINGKRCTDTVSVTVDDTISYWLMHRKE